MEELQFYDNFEKALEQDMLKVCTSAGMLDGVMLASDDIDQKWNDYANSYMADAIEQINEYPEVAIAWSLYMGMAVAQWWDVDWLQNKDNEYLKFYGPHGFDDMDDIEEPDSGMIMQRAISMIRKENIEFGSVKAFYVLSRTVKVMYRIGAALQLKRLGYKFEKLGN